MVPIDSEGRLSVSGVQVGLEDVPSVVFQMPPFTVATYMTVGAVGLARMMSTAPETDPTAVRVDCVPVTGAGPSEIHAGTSRDSNDSRRNRAIGLAGGFALVERRLDCELSDDWPG